MDQELHLLFVRALDDEPVIRFADVAREAMAEGDLLLHRRFVGRVVRGARS